MSKKITLPESYIINMYGIELQVYGYYEAAEDETNAPQGIEIVNINHENECIKIILSDEFINDIQTKILEEYY